MAPLSPAPASVRLADLPMLRALSYWLHRYRRVWRGTIVISIVNPMLFFTALGTGLGKLVDSAGSSYLHGHTYAAFFAPGLLAATTLQNAFIEAAGPVYQSTRPNGAYRVASATPLEPDDIMFGHFAYMLLRQVLNVVAFLAVTLAFGAVGIMDALVILPVTVLLGMAFAAPTAAWAVTATKSDSIHALFRFIVMPLYMFSGTFFSVQQLPTAARRLVEVSPLYQGVALDRSIALDTASLWPTLGHLAYLTTMLVAGVAVARRRYARALHV